MKYLKFIIIMGVLFSSPGFVLPALSQQTWTRIYGGRSRNWGVSVRQTTDGGYLVAGNSSYFKTDPSGKILWERTYQEGGLHHIFPIKQAADGSYLIAIREVGPTDAVNFYCIQTNEKGDSQSSLTKADDSLRDE